MLGLILAAALAAFSWPAWGHGDADWIRQNPATQACCGVQDCWVLPDEDVTLQSMTYVVRTAGRIWRIPYERKLPSIDNHYWICISGIDEFNSPEAWMLKCFFGPEAGS